MAWYVNGAPNIPFDNSMYARGKIAPPNDLDLNWTTVGYLYAFPDDLELYNIDYKLDDAVLQALAPANVGTGTFNNDSDAE